MLIGLVWLCSYAMATEYRIDRPMELQQQLNHAYHAKGSDYQPRTEHLLDDGSPVYINRLILEDAPYLLQHAHNPVDWRPWGETAFAEAKAQNKPVFLSIGYSTCHWCHVMERESFENIEIAQILNEHFIPIKVDRESHPDVDDVYMSAVLLINRQGGWPMSTFLTTQGEPFFGGTYYPPDAFKRLLNQITELWQSNQAEVIEQAKRITQAMQASEERHQRITDLPQRISQQAIGHLQKLYDEVQGGFGQAPKFPQEPWLFMLLDEARRHDNDIAKDMIEITLDHMARGGINDQIGGGFHRYSTDYEWLVPHFEKMLYNQAHLSRAYLDAWALTGNPYFKRIATNTLDYVAREMTAPSGGFYSATDADSEGEEGLFFTWTKKEIDALLPTELSGFAKEIYNISRIGNFEGRNIPHLEHPVSELAAHMKLSVPELYAKLDQINAIMLKERAGRIPPLRDDKLLTSWNGMMIHAFAHAAELLNSTSYRLIALRAAEDIWQNSRSTDGQLMRLQLDGHASVNALLEDYAYLAEALIRLYDLTHDRVWLKRSRSLADEMLKLFTAEDGSFYMNREDSHDFTGLARPRDDGADNAIPSASAVALHVLQRLWRRSGEMNYKTAADALLASLSSSIAQQPSGYGYMLTALNDLREGELGAVQYAALGGIRLEADLQHQKDGQYQLNIKLDIKHGWHINSDQPQDPDLIPTTFSLSESTSGWSVERIDYPQGLIKSMAFSQTPLSLYEGETNISVLLSRNQSQQKRAPLRGSIRIQACDDQRCLPPEIIRFDLLADSSG